MKFQFITSVAAVLLSSGHGVFAAKESVPQNCQKETDVYSCSGRMPCVWVELIADNSVSNSCCEKTDSSCILDRYGTPPPAPTPSRRCVKLGDEAADWAQTTMCQQVVSFPWKDNSHLMDCRDIATQTCKNKLTDQVMQSCGLRTNSQEVRRACTRAVNDLLGSAAVTEDYEVEPYEEEKFDYSYLSEDNKMDPYGEDFDSSTSEDVEMESYDEDFYAKKRANKRANKKRRQGGNKNPARNTNKSTMTRNEPAKNTDKVINIHGNLNHRPMENGKCPPGCTRLNYGLGCNCDGDSYLSEDNKMDLYGEDFDSSTSEDVKMESYDEDFYAKKRANKRANKKRRQGGNKNPARNTNKSTMTSGGSGGNCVQKCDSPYPGIQICRCI